MGRINGIGTALLGLRRTDWKDPNFGYATKWFTFAFLPIVPLARKKIRIVPSPRGGSGFHFQELGETSVEPHEVILTYLTGWILWPAVLFGPFFVLMGPLGKEALAYVWIFGSSIAAMVLRDRRYRYQPDPKRERMVRSVRDVEGLLRRAGVSDAKGRGTLTHYGYVLAASMIAADGEIREAEVQAAALIGQRLFPGFSNRDFANVVAHHDGLPDLASVAELLRDAVPEDGKKAITQYLEAIAAADREVSPAETERLAELRRAWH